MLGRGIGLRVRAEGHGGAVFVRTPTPQVAMNVTLLFLIPGALPNTSLSFMSVFSFCTLKWWGAILASHSVSEVGKKSFSRVTSQVIARPLR